MIPRDQMVGSKHTCFAILMDIAKLYSIKKSCTNVHSQIQWKRARYILEKLYKLDENVGKGQKSDYSIALCSTVDAIGCYSYLEFIMSQALLWALN